MGGENYPKSLQCPIEPTSKRLQRMLGSLLEVANQDPDVALGHQAALEGAMMLDWMEDKDARRTPIRDKPH